MLFLTINPSNLHVYQGMEIVESAVDGKANLHKALRVLFSLVAKECFCLLLFKE